MSDHQATTSGDHEPATSSDQSDQQAAGLSIAAAARRLGVSENAVRQRIKRETIRAEKVAGVWQVFPADHEADQQCNHQATGRPTTASAGRDHEGDHELIEAAYRVTPAEIEQAIERTAATYVVDMRTMFDEVGRLYEAQLAAKDETIGELRRRSEAAESRVSALEAEQAESPPVEPSSAPQAATGAATDRPGKIRQHRWWLRLFGVDE